MLAALAERGILRQVEVISTVSGGSIVGALYYLRLKAMLEEEPDGDAADPDHDELDARYCELVVDVERRLRAAVRKNLRARLTANLPGRTCRWCGRATRAVTGSAISTTGISTSEPGSITPIRPRAPTPRAGGAGVGGVGPEEQLAMRELRIEPLDAKAVEGVGPYLDRLNAVRSNKVPALLVNATTLNSGHAWRFEAIRMGEAVPTDPERARRIAGIDKNLRLEPAYFDQTSRGDREGCLVPEGKRDFPFAKAVAASAAVPGIFNPLAIHDVYLDLVVELVDGGVEDNQGLQGLIDHDCTHLIVSDASRQMDDEEKPATTIVAVGSRVGSIAGDRIRDLQMIGLAGGARPHAILDLRHGLRARAVRPIGCEEPETEPAASKRAFGVAERIQRLLAAVRTDLDFFSKVEASSLELDGYRLAEGVIGTRGAVSHAISTPAALRRRRRDGNWVFAEQVGPLFNCESVPNDLQAHLEAAKSRFLRPYKIPGSLTALAATVAYLAVSPLPSGRCAGRPRSAMRSTQSPAGGPRRPGGRSWPSACCWSPPRSSPACARPGSGGRPR